MAEQQSRSGWKRFWEKGGWWRSLLLVVAYYAVWQGVTLLIGPLLLAAIPEGNEAMAVLMGTGVSVAIGCVLLIVFALSVGWLRELFQKQPIGGSWWMWIAVVVTAGFNILHFMSIDYGKAGAVATTWIISSLFVGFAEEVLTRGLVVNLMRKAGYREIVVAVVSAALFAALHAGNLLSGAPLFNTAFQLVYTFAFGLCMYLAMRVGGSIWWPILIHGTTDSSIFIYNEFHVTGSLAALAGQGNIVVVFTGLILLIFIRGRVNAPASQIANEHAPA